MLCLAVVSAYSQRIKGSDTTLPITQKLSEEYIKIHPNADIIVTGGGSGVGLSALRDNTTDIAMSSRPMKFSEKLKFKQTGQEIVEVIIAYDALAVIVNPANRVSKLTREQLEAVYRGKITNWKELGGDDMKIIVYSRETSSGTYEFFKESVLKNKNYMSSVLAMPATGAIIQSVAQTKGAIGYVGLAYLNPRIKALGISYDSFTYSLPTLENAMSKTYPIVRPLFYYYDAAKEKTVSPFIEFVLSDKAQKIVKDNGFVPLNSNQLKVSRDSRK